MRGPHNTCTTHAKHNNNTTTTHLAKRPQRRVADELAERRKGREERRRDKDAAGAQHARDLGHRRRRVGPAVDRRAGVDGVDAARLKG